MSDSPCEHDAIELSALSSSQLDRAARLFRALGDPGRLTLLACLQSGEACVSELANTVGGGMSTVSQRLKLLHVEGLVSRRREGKHIYYGLADQHVVELVANALAHAAEGPR